MREYHIKRYYVKKREIISKLGGKCKKCGATKNLQIDHINPKDKQFSVTLLLSFSWKKVENEIKKCQLLCKKHHMEKTILEQGNKIAKGNHGTLSSYRYCHCEICKIAMRDWTRKYRLTHDRKDK